jgi:hypothetical protein
MDSWTPDASSEGQLLDAPSSLRQRAPVTAGNEFPGTERKKHRHDLGHEDHGPKLAAGTTKTIQALLGLWIALTIGFVVYALVDTARPHPSAAAGAVPTSAPVPK